MLQVHYLFINGLLPFFQMFQTEIRSGKGKTMGQQVEIPHSMKGKAGNRPLRRAGPPMTNDPDPGVTFPLDAGVT